MKRTALALGLLAGGCGCPGTVMDIGQRSFCAEVADTEAARSAGLRGREPLAADEALLLPFPVEDEICIVNDGVDFAIDVAYADSLRRVVALERGVPANDGTARCHPTTQTVLEVAAGGLEGVPLGVLLIEEGALER